jgi:hypothetical protein
VRANTLRIEVGGAMASIAGEKPAVIHYSIGPMLRLARPITAEKRGEATDANSLVELV